MRIAIEPVLFYSKDVGEVLFPDIWVKKPAAHKIVIYEKTHKDFDFVSWVQKTKTINPASDECRLCIESIWLELW